MITPFGRPTLLIASSHVAIAQSLSQLVRLFHGDSLPHHFPEENVITLSCIEDLHSRLDSLERREIFNSVCILDLTAENGGIQWNISEDKHRLRPSELVLRYPEVYWIFIVRSESDMPELGLIEKNLHFITQNNLLSIVSLLSRHAHGFRAYFDPTSLRGFLRVNTSADKGRHSAPHRSQFVASALLRRAHKIKQNAATPEEGVHAALLALEAWKILNGKTPVLCLEALAVLHQMEALAECSFLGAASSLPVEKRFRELEEQVGNLIDAFAFSDASMIFIQAHISKVWEALVNSDMIKQYMLGTTAISDWKEGAWITWEGEWQDEKFKYEGLIQKLMPGRLIQFSNIKSVSGSFDVLNSCDVVTIELAGKESLVIVSVSEENKYNEQKCEQSKKNWRMVIESLKILLEKRNKKYAAAIDEEEYFLLLNGYLLYSFGYNTYLVGSANEGKKIFGDSNKYAVEVVMEDIDLRFGDIPENERESYNLKKRGTSLKGLNNVNRRIFVSAAYKDLWEIRDELVDYNGDIESITKPYGGIFEERLYEKLGNKRDGVCLNSSISSFDSSDGISRQYQINSALVEVADDLRQIYSEYGQFDEAEKALAKARKYRSNLIGSKDRVHSESMFIPLIRKSLLQKPVGFPFFSIFPLYFNWLIESFRNIVLAITCWVVFFGVMYTFTLEASPFEAFIGGLYNSASTFMALQPADNIPDLQSSSLKYWFWFLTVAEIIGGAAHLGIFITYLYQKISRK